MIHFILLFSRQGKIRLQKWYEAQAEKDKKKITRELTSVILARKPKMSNFLEWKGLQVNIFIYTKYFRASKAYSCTRFAIEVLLYYIKYYLW